VFGNVTRAVGVPNVQSSKQWGTSGAF
jgi:hypothetical protein